MADLKKTHDEQVAMWRDLRKENYQHWRAWGSWFSWGSPVGLGLFIVLLSIAFAIVKWAISL
jgi:hypothetical protein